jgi:hypothetical protein
MTHTLPLSLRIYDRLLVLYPDDLRRDHGTEMALVFAEDLNAARRTAGWRGTMRVWRCVLGEFLRFALPECLSSPAVRVPLISLALFVATTGAEISLALRHSVHPASYFHANGVAVVLPMFASPFIALLAVWTCRGGTATSLHLSGTNREEH